MSKKTIPPGKVQCEYEIRGAKDATRQCPNPARYLVRFFVANERKLLVARREARCYWHTESAKFFPEESLTPSIIGSPLDGANFPTTQQIHQLKPWNKR